MVSAADLLPYEYEDAVLLSNCIFAVTNQGTCFIWDTSNGILPLSQFICFEFFCFISFKFKFRAPHHMLRLQCPLNHCVHVPVFIGHLFWSRMHALQVTFLPQF